MARKAISKGRSTRIMSRHRQESAAIALVLMLVAVTQAQPVLDTGGNRDIVAGQTIVLHSGILESDFQLSIHLPTGYSESTARYPVLITLDDFFDLAVGVVNTLKRGDYIPDMIVISINGPHSNLLLPSPSADGLGGDADKLVQVLRKELLPAIDSAYRTQPYRVLYGSSWAGVFAAYAVLTSPETISAGLSAGPWLTYDGNQRYVLNHLTDWLADHDYRHNYLFFTGGAQPEIVPNMEEFAALLGDHTPAGLLWTYDPMPEEDHYSLKLRTLMAGLGVLFSVRRNLPDSVVVGGSESIKAYVNQVNAHFGYNIGLSQGALSTKGWELYADGETDRALEVMRLGVELSPESPTVVYSLGRLLHLSGDLEGARNNYEKALVRLEPSQTGLRSAYEHQLNKVREELKALKK
jgi:enterochelin esterase-like enzyme